jgi:cytochrome c-type biogenesis protein CcmH
MRFWLLPLLLLSAPLVAQEQGAPDAPLAYAQLDDPAQEAAASALMETIRCVQCQGQTIADSDAPIAAAMRHEIREQIGAGKSPDQVKQWLIDRYGEWVTYDPRFNPATAPLYLIPLFMLLIGGFMAWRRFSGPKPDQIVENAA